LDDNCINESEILDYIKEFDIDKDGLFNLYLGALNKEEFMNSFI
jgi:hypothetical protein